MITKVIKQLLKRRKERRLLEDLKQMAKVWVTEMPRNLSSERHISEYERWMMDRAEIQEQIDSLPPDLKEIAETHFRPGDEYFRKHTFYADINLLRIQEDASKWWYNRIPRWAYDEKDPGMFIYVTRRDPPSEPKSEEERWFLHYIKRQKDAVRLNPREDLKHHPCPCCKWPTLECRGGLDVCFLCNWKDDGQDDPYADEVWGVNEDYSLTEARRNFAERLSMYREQELVKKSKLPVSEVFELKKLAMELMKKIEALPPQADAKGLEGELQAVVDKLGGPRRFFG